MTIEETIIDALTEAVILENGLDEYDEDHMLFTAIRLSGCSYPFVKMVYERNRHIFRNNVFDMGALGIY